MIFATIALAAALLTFGSGVAGLLVQRYLPEHHMPNETRDLINRIAGLVATMSAVVLGLLIASTNGFYNAQKSGMEMLSARALQLDGVLQRYGPETKPMRGAIKDAMVRAYEQTWGNASTADDLPTIWDAARNLDQFAGLLSSLQPATEAQRMLLSRAVNLATSVGDLRLQMALQVTNSLSWPFLMVLVSWTSLLFFGFGLLSRINIAAVAALAVGAFAVGSAIFLIVELSNPYSGTLRLPPTSLLQAIEVLGK